MSNTANDKDFWKWFEEGISKGYVTESFCQTHDGGYGVMTDEERNEWEQGGDPCMTVTRVVWLG
jgi:hypothetical protein